MVKEEKEVLDRWCYIKQTPAAALLPRSPLLEALLCLLLLIIIIKKSEGNKKLANGAQDDTCRPSRRR